MAGPIFSDPGVALATFLHTFGAIGYMGGIAFYIGWSRSLQRGHDNPTVLATGASLTYTSILANLLGGFVRTYQPGHPGLTDLGASTWVTIMVAKHAVLFAGMGAAVYLFELHAPRMRRALRQKVTLPARRTRNAHAMMGTVVASILVAAILGGASTVVELGGAAPQDARGIEIPEREPPYTLERSGTVTAGGPEGGTFEVPVATSRLAATLTAPPPQGLPANPFHFTLTLFDPTGASVGGDTQGQGPTDPRRVQVEAPAPAAGTWRYQVSGDAAAAAAYSLEIVIERALILEETLDLQAGQAFEINVQAARGAVLSWDWEATAHMEWNVHTHAGGFRTLDEQHTDAAAGEAAVEEEGTYSFFWRPESGARLSFRVWGDFTVTSITGI